MNFFFNKDMLNVSLNIMGSEDVFVFISPFFCFCFVVNGFCGFPFISCICL